MTIAPMESYRLKSRARFYAILITLGLFFLSDVPHSSAQQGNRAPKRKVSLATAQKVARTAVSTAVTSAPSQVGAITAASVNAAIKSGSARSATGIAGAAVGGAITALPAQANLITSTALNTAISSNERRGLTQRVVAAIANAAVVNAAFAAIANGGDRQAAEQAAAEVATIISETTVNTRFSNIVSNITLPSSIQEAITQAQAIFDSGGTPNTDGGTGTPGGPEASGDTVQPRVEPGGKADGNFPPIPPQPTAPPAPTATPTPSPTLTPKPSNG